MNWIATVLLVTPKSARRETVCELLADDDIETYVAANSADAHRLHTKKPIDLVVVDMRSMAIDNLFTTASKRHSDKFAQQKPGITVDIVSGSETASDILDRVTNRDDHVAAQCDATFVHPDGETVTTNYGDVVPVNDEAVRVGDIVDLPDWAFDDGVEIVVGDRRGDVRAAFEVGERRSVMPGGQLEVRAPSA